MPHPLISLPILYSLPFNYCSAEGELSLYQGFNWWAFQQFIWVDLVVFLSLIAYTFCFVLFFVFTTETFHFCFVFYHHDDKIIINYQYMLLIMQIISISLNSIYGKGSVYT